MDRTFPDPTMGWGSETKIYAKKRYPAVEKHILRHEPPRGHLKIWAMEETLRIRGSLHLLSVAYEGMSR
jgi:hypothetical protein